VWLRFGDHDVELLPGETIIGRSPKCQLVLDDLLVSRSHARIVTKQGTVTIEDLGSANGVLVNGERLMRARVLVSGDRVVIGQQTFQVQISMDSDLPKKNRLSARTLSGFKGADPEVRTQEMSQVSEATRKGDAFALLIGVAEKVLALGRGDEAERILASFLRNLLQNAKVGGTLDPATAEKAALYAMRIAEATGKGLWVDYLFELYSVAKRPLPGPVVDRLYESIRKLSPVSALVFRQYRSVLRLVEPELGPADRFLMRRIEGLESLGALK
jgi:hypothetical protein